jgi:hypothetical protein
MNKTHRKYAIKGLLGGASILLMLAICMIIFLAYQFDGQCGGWMSFISGPHNCSLLEFLVTDVFFIIQFAVVVSLPGILIFLFLATLIGYGLGRLKTKSKQFNP